MPASVDGSMHRSPPAAHRTVIADLRARPAARAPPAAAQPDDRSRRRMPARSPRWLPPDWATLDYSAAVGVIFLTRCRELTRRAALVGDGR